MLQQPPILDSRTLQDILQQLQEQALIDVPDWTPPQEGDAGTMMQLMFARLLEIALERLNRVPDKNLLAFLDTMGLWLLPPSPAQVPLTFSLTPGTAATLVPRGTQAGTQPSGEQPTVIFETEDDLTVIPAQLTTGFTMDPTWDRYTDQTSVLDRQSAIGFTPFVGTQRMPHILYLGDNDLLNFTQAIVDVNLQWEPVDESSLDDLRTFLQELTWQYTHNGQLKLLTPTVPITATKLSGDPSEDKTQVTLNDITGLIVGDELNISQGDNTESFRIGGFGANNLVRLSSPLENSYSASADVKLISPPAIRLLNVETIDQTIVQGISADLAIHQGIENRWLQAVLTTPFPDALVAQKLLISSLKLSNLKLKVSASRLLPDLAFSDTVPVDVKKDFFPFGEIPEVGNTFYLASEEVFAKAGAQVTLRFNVRLLPQSKLVWEHFDFELEQWRPFVIIPVQPSEGEQNFNELLQQILAEQREIFPFLIDETAGFTRSGVIVGLAWAMGTTIINGVTAFWVRTRLSGGGYNRPPKIEANGFMILAQDNQMRSPEVGFVNQTSINFSNSFLPFGEKPNSTDIFSFGEKNQAFPGDLGIEGNTLIRVQVNPDPDLSDIQPPVDLEWEYLSESGWAAIPNINDSTAVFTKTGTVTFTMPTIPPAVREEVNGQANYWIRVRIASGDYGRPEEFVPVDPNDPSKGFTLKPGTGNVLPPQIESLALDYTAEQTPTVVTQNGFLYSDQTSANNADTGFAPFVSVKDLPPIYADTKPTFYLGLDVAFPEQPVSLYITVAPQAFAGRVIKESRTEPAPSSALPPLQWEYFNGVTWQELTVIDRTNDLTESGTVKFLTPSDIAALAKFDLTERYWIRARSSENDPFDTQQLGGVFLNTIPATQAVTVTEEILGSSNGQPNQTLRFTRTPILPGQQVIVREPEPPPDRERQAIEREEGESAIQERINPTTGETEIWVRWHEVANFLLSDSYSRHYTLDRTTGLLTFGNGKRGIIPPPGTNNITATYRTGGGTVGNVPLAAVNQIKSSLPGVAAVTNPTAADGGAAVETVSMVRIRGPQTLKHRDRAVTCSDLEWLARQAAGTRVARTKCLPNVNRDLRFEPGWVTLLIVPRGSSSKLSPSSELIRQLENYLEARAFVGLTQLTPARVNVIGPGYIQVTVVAEVVPRDIDEAQSVKQRVITALAAFFQPLTGGPKDRGWEFGRDVYVSEVCRVTEEVPGVSHVKQIQLLPNIAQHRLTLKSVLNPALNLPVGSLVITMERQKSAILAEPLLAGSDVTRIAVKGFKEGDRITKVLDIEVQSVSETTITVNQFNSDSVGFPRGSVVMTFDGTRRTRLPRGIPRNDTVKEIVVEDAKFASQLQKGDRLTRLTVLYPFPLTITSVTVDVTKSVQILSIEPYEAEVAFPEGSLLATLDNQIRRPLRTELPANQSITTIELNDFTSGDRITIVRRNSSYETPEKELEAVQPINDIVYLDDNFLVYPGAHRITMVSGAAMQEEGVQ